MVYSDGFNKGGFFLVKGDENAEVLLEILRTNPQLRKAETNLNAMSKKRKILNERSRRKKPTPQQLISSGK